MAGRKGPKFGRPAPQAIFLRTGRLSYKSRDTSARLHGDSEYVVGLARESVPTKLHRTRRGSVHSVR